MKKEKQNQVTVNPFTINFILECLPHRYPFLMVDRVLELIPGKKARGVKLVTIDDELLKGVDPSYPRWPEIFFIEPLAQLAAVVAGEDKGPEGGRGLLVQVKNFEMHKNPLPGDIIFLEVERAASFGALHQFSGRAFIQEELAAQGELVFTLTAIG